MLTAEQRGAVLCDSGVLEAVRGRFTRAAVPPCHRATLPPCHRDTMPRCFSANSPPRHHAAMPRAGPLAAVSKLQKVHVWVTCCAYRRVLGRGRLSDVEWCRWMDVGCWMLDVGFGCWMLAHNTTLQIVGRITPESSPELRLACMSALFGLVRKFPYRLARCYRLGLLNVVRSLLAVGCHLLYSFPFLCSAFQFDRFSRVRVCARELERSSIACIHADG
jgi:hypothetical protein